MTIQLHWTAGLHHDGSAMYVSNPLPTQGEMITITLRTPVDAPIKGVYLRTTPDGEEKSDAMQRERTDGVCAWWVGMVRMTMPVLLYRFRVLSTEGAYWLNAGGVSRAESPDHNDFRLLANFAAPHWVDQAVFYQIFPDRFYNGDTENDVPPGAWSRRGYQTQQRAWGELPLSYQEAGNLDFYGGDLEGVRQKLDYLKDLGVNGIFLNPIFSAYSNHRYDIADYHHVDPHLGGDGALADLRQAMDEYGMRLVLDVTPNHCGEGNVWFKAAQADANAPTADYFTFHHHPDDYETWLGHRSLVKLNYRSQALREAMYRAPDSVMRRWMHEPYRIDGWRLDVANMTARQGMVQLSHKVWREMRRAVKEERSDIYFFGENFYDGSPHLQGDELDAVMNYRGFTIPLWSWLQPDVTGIELPEWYDPIAMPAEAMAKQWTRFRAAIPWVIARQQFNQLGSHDTPRILWILGGNRAMLKLAVTILMTFPGVPCIYYGDEIGMDGSFDPDNRRCMRWDESTWDHDLRKHYQFMIQKRRTAPALREGGFQMVYAEGGLVAYQRQTRQQRLITIAWRGPEKLLPTTIPLRHAGIEDGIILTDLLSNARFSVHEGGITISDFEAGTVMLLEG